MQQLDEDTFVIPDTWRGKTEQWRGSPLTHHVAADEDAVARLRARKPEVESSVAGAAGDARLLTAARSYLRGEANAVGAAVVGAVLGHTTHGPQQAAIADLWTAEHGIVFAATAAAELAHVFSKRHSAGKGYEYRVETPGNGEWPSELLSHNTTWGILQRVRALLAVTDEQSYRDVVAALADHRDGHAQQVVVAYLVPTETSWVDEVFAVRVGAVLQARRRPLLLWVARSARHLELLALSESWLADERYLFTVAERVGPAVAPFLANALDSQHGVASRRMLLGVLGVLPSDEAFDLLVARLDQRHVHDAVIEAMRRYPVRALRRLAAAVASAGATARFAARLLRGHLSANPELTATVLPTLPAEVRAAVDTVDQVTGLVVQATSDDLPPLLVDPPWTRKRTAGKPVVVKGLTAAVDPAINWADGEQRRWAETDTHYVPADAPHGQKREYWDNVVRKYRERQLDLYGRVSLFVEGPEDLVRPLLADWQPQTHWDLVANEWLKLVVARFGLDALPPVLAFGRAHPAQCGDLLLPFVSSEVAELMAHWLRLRSVRQVARAWFRRHRTAAVRALVPPAVGKAGRQRRNAEAALRFLASACGPDEVVEIARGHGDKAAGAVSACLTADPLDDFPRTLPKTGEWLDVRPLPQVLLSGRGQALPADAVEHLLTMLAMSWPGEGYAGVEVVRQSCDPASLAEFGWALLAQARQVWQDDDATTDWVLPALRWLGNDDTVRKLTPLIRRWPGTGHYAKAVLGLDVLAAIGTDTALIHLNSIAQNAKSKGLRTKAEEKIAELAANIGLSQEQLADRLVPDFGLAADGSLTLDYGPRRFTVGFDESLTPFVANADGNRLKALPKPGARDDQELAPAAHKRFSALKKDVRTVATDQISRLERAMVTQRRWPAGEFQDLFVDHPLLWHIVRRLVWTTDDGSAPFTAFRVAEDRTLADADDDTLTLPDTAQVGIAHPVHLGDTVSAWAEIFADYQILQPFRQLGRSVHALTEDERTSSELKRFHGSTVPTGTVLGFARGDWERAADVNRSHIQQWITRRVPGNRFVVVKIDPGIEVLASDTFPEQRIESVWLGDRPGGHRNAHPSRWFGDLDPVTASEVLADLTTLTTI